MPSFLSGIWGYLISVGAAAVVAGGAAVGVTHWVDTLSYGHTIDGLKLVQAQQHDANTQKAINQLTGFIDNIHIADQNYNNSLADIDARFQALQGTMKNATQKPLPVDCKPDPGRMQYAASAIAAANANSGNPARSGATVPGP